VSEGASLRWARLKALIVHRVLGVEDTPHRIAWGVAVGTVIAFTPTIGLQIMLYLLFATLLRANKVSGVPILFISNPVTMLPLYWFCGKVGAFCLGHTTERGGRARLEAGLASANDAAAETNLLEDIWTSEFWANAWEVMKEMGGEIWLGSTVLGVGFAVPLYFATRIAVQRFRRRRAPS
jgi:uncharacterized protein (DUF2062 family)